MSEKEPDWIWYGRDDDGKIHLSYGRWQSHKCQKRYKLAEIQPTEHDHPGEFKPQQMLALTVCLIGDIEVNEEIKFGAFLTGGRAAVQAAGLLIGKTVIIREDR